MVEGANVAFLEKKEAGDPKVSNLVAVRRELKERGYNVAIIIDASLRHNVDKTADLEVLIDDRVVQQAPAGKEADYFVI